MKKSDIALIAGVIVVLIIGVFLMGNSKSSNTSQTMLTKLSYSEYQEKIDNGETFIFIIERKGCSHCQNYMPIAKKFAKKYSVPMYYIDTDDLSEDEWTSLESSNSFFTENADDWGTPTTMVLKGSECLENIVGETDEDTLYELYTKYKDDLTVATTSNSNEEESE